MDGKVIGITTCEHCNSRFRLRERHARMDGKPARCPKCHQVFTLRIQRPSMVEQAAIEASEEQEKKRVRRTKAEIRQEHLERIKDSFRAFHPRLARIAEDERSSEEEVRRWCVEVLRDALGHEDGTINTELRCLNKRVDIALVRDDRVFMVVECKNIRSRLPKSAIDQAVAYAVNRTADWAVVTNGQQWRLYRVVPVPGRDPRVTQIFDVALLDADGMSNRDAEMLYLLTARAIFSGDSERFFHRIGCTSDRRLIAAMSSDRVIRAVRIELLESYRDNVGERVALEDAHVEERIRELFLPSDL
jgi:predicted Zn finger-like uncharacterized protein